MLTGDYKEFLYEELQDTDTAAGYLSECFASGMDVFLIALKDVIEAKGGIDVIANETKLNRDDLNNLLSKKDNPNLSSLGLILNALDIKIKFKAKVEEEKEAA